MNRTTLILISVALASSIGVACAETITTAEVMESLEDSDWRRPDPLDLLYLDLPNGTVIIELAPDFAPASIANIRTLVREKYFDGLAIIRSQDNYVVQWGDPIEEEADARSIGSAKSTIPAEFSRSVNGIELVEIESNDAYADRVGFANGFPVGSDGKQLWLSHCYGMVGIARGNELDSGNGTSLYVVTGHAPRHLDRNITLAGRVLSGIELLTTLPRGNGPLGFYETADERTPIVRSRLGSDLDDKNSLDIKVLRTDTDAFSDYVKSRTFRHEAWFTEPTGRIEICNITPPVRVAP
jgi:peptidylprolyl isomerase